MAPPTKRRKIAAVEDITFDLAAREDYLSGFHKRKVQRTKHAQDEAAKRERQEKVEVRKQLRDQRKKDLHSHVEAVNAMLKKAERGDTDDDTEHESNDGKDADEDDGGAGHTVADGAPVDGAVRSREDEYVDEDRYTTVTVKAMNLSGDEDTSSEDNDSEDGGDDAGAEQESTGTRDGMTKKNTWTKQKPMTAKPKKKRKKFRYESKIERKATRSKQNTRNRTAAAARREK